MHLIEGTTLKDGKYQIVKTLGKGGFGITYLAKSKEITSGAIGGFEITINVALKEFFVKDECTRDSDGKTMVLPNSQTAASQILRYKEKFKKEVKNIASMNHPNIVRVSDVFEENNTVYYTMQYLEGGSLSDIIMRNGPLPEQKAIKYVTQIAGALQYMHDKNICHLDVKPGNIVISSDDDAMLIDFGISKRYDETGQESTTMPVGVSAGYAPIEQYHGTLHDFSPATDVYGLGATFYFLLTGKTPPEASTVLDKGMGERPQEISEGIWQIICKAMQPKRKDRMATMGELLDAIKTYSDTSSSTKTKASEPTDTSDPGEILYGGETILLDDDNPLPIDETIIPGKGSNNRASASNDKNGKSEKSGSASAHSGAASGHSVSASEKSGSASEKITEHSSKSKGGKKIGLLAFLIGFICVVVGSFVWKNVINAPKPVSPHDFYSVDDDRYSIVGEDYVVTAREGDNLQKIAKRTLGPDMACYLVAFNGIPENQVLMVGQKIKIPKLRSNLIQVENYPLPDGTIFSGTLFDGKPEGKGEALYADGRIYVGNFEKGLRVDSNAYFVYPNKNIFKGEFAGDTIRQGRVDTPDTVDIPVYFIGTFSSGKPYDGYWYYTADDSKWLRWNKGKEEEL